MFRGDFNLKVIGSLYPITGIINTEKYSKVVWQNVVREMEWTLIAGGDIFKDLAPCHSAK